ncbi:MAG: hypothetical protein QW711_04625 [Candidatus Korarchaeum sp.]
MRVVHVRLPPEILKLIDTEASVKGLRRSELLRSIILAYFDDRSLFRDRIKGLLELGG